jgi:hypothetical protein
MKAAYEARLLTWASPTEMLVLFPLGMSVVAMAAVSRCIGRENAAFAKDCDLCHRGRGRACTLWCADDCDAPTLSYCRERQQRGRTNEDARRNTRYEVSRALSALAFVQAAGWTKVQLQKRARDKLRKVRKSPSVSLRPVMCSVTGCF